MIVLEFTGGFRGVLNWIPMMPRDASQHIQVFSCLALLKRSGSKHILTSMTVHKQNSLSTMHCRKIFSGKHTMRVKHFRKTFLLESPRAAKRCIPRSSLHIALARQLSVQASQNVKKPQVHVPALINKSYLRKNSGVDSIHDYPRIVFVFFFFKKISINDLLSAFH